VDKVWKADEAPQYREKVKEMLASFTLRVTSDLNGLIRPASEDPDAKSVNVDGLATPTTEDLDAKCTSGDKSLTADENEVFSLSFARWRASSYALRLEECLFFMRIFNLISNSLKCDTLFLASPAHGIAHPMRLLDWSANIDADMVSLLKSLSAYG
jgi:hypothetical protein